MLDIQLTQQMKVIESNVYVVWRDTPGGAGTPDDILFSRSKKIVEQALALPKI